MAKYRKKILTEAHKISDEDYPLWLSVMFAQGRVWLDEDSYVVATREGLKATGLDDWIAIDSNGDPYPIADDVFSATYELVEDQ